MAKKILFVCVLALSFSALLTPISFATSGACSYHSGVNCGAGPSTTGSVVCNDGWINSSVSYYETDECSTQSRCPRPIIYGCTSQSEIQSLIDQRDKFIRGCEATMSFSGLGGSATAASSCNASDFDAKIDACQQQIDLNQKQQSLYLDCILHPVALPIIKKPSCQDSMGINSYYDDSNKTCTCSVGFYIKNGTCLSGSSICGTGYQAQDVDEYHMKCVPTIQNTASSGGSVLPQVNQGGGMTLDQLVAATAPQQVVPPAPDPYGGVTNPPSNLGLKPLLFADVSQKPITKNLSIGSSGDDVSTLQGFLERKGYLTMPSGISNGYFGSLTKQALIAFQRSVGLPTTGYCGLMTKGAINGSQ